MEQCFYTLTGDMYGAIEVRDGKRSIERIFTELEYHSFKLRLLQGLRLTYYAA